MNLNETSKEFYSDFDIEFRRNALTGDVIKKKNLDDIRQSLGLLLETRFYDRKWHPEIGSYVPTMLFEQDDEYFRTVLTKQITNLIAKYEPRISVVSINIDHESAQDMFHGRLTIRINYTVNVLNIKDTYVYSINRLR
jgi:phage baseplate assembly protein W